MRRRDHETIVAELRGRVRFLERQVEQLLDRLMYATGQTWTPPPAPALEDLEPVEPYSFAPEQHFDAALAD